MTEEQQAPITRDEIQAKYGSTAATAPRNPYVAAIRIIWVLAAIAGVILSIIAAGKSALSIDALTLNIYAGSCFSLAVMGALIHLAVNAVRWKPSA